MYDLLKTKQIILIFEKIILGLKLKMKAIGIINIVLGCLYLGGNLIGLIVIFIEKMIFSSMRSMPYNEFVPFDIYSYLNDILNMMLMNFPISLIVYGMLLFGGIKILKKDNLGIKLTKASAWSTIGWYFFYIILAYITLSPYFQFFEGSSIIMNIVFVIGGIIGFVVTCGYPIFLIIYFKKDRSFNNKS